MGIISPDEIATKAEKAYARFLRQWIRGKSDDFFPWQVRTNLSLDAKRPDVSIAEIDRLLSHSKEVVGWGYTVHRERRRSQDLGSNEFPTTITVDTLDDLLRLAKSGDDFAAVTHLTEQVRTELPQLESWLQKNVRSVSSIAECCDGLILVAKFFIENPWPDCYARQIPVHVDTKFVHRNHRILRQWLDELLPDSAIDINEQKFARRFGLRDGEPHRGIRLLDPELSKETNLPFCELSLPMRLAADLPVRDATIFIVENDLNLLTMPTFRRGIGIRGEGNAVNRLERIPWLAQNRVYYWGDIDVDGFVILSRLRNLFPNVASLMMDTPTLESQREYIVDGNGTRPDLPTNLTNSEADAFAHCARENRRLEQEKIHQAYVDSVFENLSRNDDRI